LQISDITAKYPNSLTLLDNSIVLLTQDKIRFFSEYLGEELTNKEITLDQNITESELYKIGMAQFSNDYNGYILILVNGLIHIFDSNKNLIKKKNISNGVKSGKRYSLIPYKKDGNILYFIISYNEDYVTYFHLEYFSININENDSDLTSIKSKTINIPLSIASNLQISLGGASCSLMSPISSLSITNKLLTCFCFLRPSNNYIYSTTMNPEDNFSEISELNSIKEHGISSLDPDFVSSVTEESQKRAFIYAAGGHYNIWMEFDFTNKLSSLGFAYFGETYSFRYESYKHHLYYFVLLYYYD
jgi:hypothetical protein